MIIRRAELDDAMAIADVHVRSWKAAYPGQIPQGYLDSLHPEDRVEGWQLVLARTDWPREGVFLLVETPATSRTGSSTQTESSTQTGSPPDAGASSEAGPSTGAGSSGAEDGKAVGFSHICPTRDDDRDLATTGEITSIYLAPEIWGSGNGRMLMDVSLDEMLTAGYETASLWALDTNARARRFYEIGGWKADGATKVHDWGSFTCTDVRYLLDLKSRQIRS